MLKKYVNHSEPVVHFVMSVIDSEQIDKSDVRYDQEECYFKKNCLKNRIEMRTRIQLLARKEKQTMNNLFCRYGDVLSDVQD